MKKFGWKLLCLTLALSFVLCACGKTPEEDTTPATEAAITTEEALHTALDSSGRVTLGADLQLTGEALIRGHVFDGGGYTLTGPQYADGVVETENGITMSGGTVENVTVKGAYRGIGDRSGCGANEDVRINNVTVDSDTYTLNFGYGSGTANMYVTGSTLQGWTSFTKFTNVQFTDCTFGWCESGKYGNLRPYVNTTLTNCKFEGKTDESGAVTPFGISFKSGTDGILLVLEDCYVGETLITQENLNQLLNVSLEGNRIEVRNGN